MVSWHHPICFRLAISALHTAIARTLSLSLAIRYQRLEETTGQHALEGGEGRKGRFFGSGGGKLCACVHSIGVDKGRKKAGFGINDCHDDGELSSCRFLYLA